MQGDRVGVQQRVVQHAVPRVGRPSGAPWLEAVAGGVDIGKRETGLGGSVGFGGCGGGGVPVFVGCTRVRQPFRGAQTTI